MRATNFEQIPVEVVKQLVSHVDTPDREQNLIPERVREIGTVNNVGENTGSPRRCRQATERRSRHR